MINPNGSRKPLHSRRKFVTDISILAGTGVFMFSPLYASAKTKKMWTVGEIIDRFIKEVEGAPFQNTVDTLKTGSREMEVSGVVTTMFATIPVIRQAISLKANFIIAHEPTFYSHTDKTDWLENDATYQFKSKLLNNNKIAVWRNHDYIHSHKPDGVYDGVLDKLGWKEYTNMNAPWNVEIPTTTLSQLIAFLKNKLNISSLRYIGDDNQRCKKILLMPGAAGGESQIRAIGRYNPDVAIVGELQEWETAEYIRDTQASGKKMSLIVLGHTDSEDGGSAYMKQWLNQKMPELKVTHIHSGNPFRFG